MKPDRSFSFVYSARPGTPAADCRWTPREPVRAVAESQERLESQTQSISDAWWAPLSALVEGASETRSAELAGRTDNNRGQFPAPDLRVRPLGEFVDLIIPPPCRTAAGCLRERLVLLDPVQISFTPVDNERLSNLCGVL